MLQLSDFAWETPVMTLDEVLTQAYTDLNASRQVSSDDIACDPAHRIPYLDLVHRQLPDLAEAVVLRRLFYLRKRSRLPRGPQSG
jgi:hypothetical protein